MNFFSSWQVDSQSPPTEAEPAATDRGEATESAAARRASSAVPQPPAQHGHAQLACLSTLLAAGAGLNEVCRRGGERLSDLRLSDLRLRDVRLTVPDLPVQAVADYSVGYGKQVFFGVVSAARKWRNDDASAMAAGVAYYLALSLFPMLLLLTAGLGLVFRFTRLGHDAELQILSVVSEHCSPTLEQQVREVLAQLREHSLVGGPFGLLTALLAAIGVFYQFERAFDRIWKVKPLEDANWRAACLRIISQRFSACLLLASVGLSIVIILLANLAVGFVHAWMASLRIPGTFAITAVDACATLLLNAAVFGMLYRWLPKRRIQWTDAFRGGLLAALVWEAGRQLLGAILIGVRYTAAYGAIGSFIALLLWCYWGVSIIFFGAEYAQVLSDERRQRREGGRPSQAECLEPPPSSPERIVGAESSLPCPTVPRRAA